MAPTVEPRGSRALYLDAALMGILPLLDAPEPGTRVTVPIPAVEPDRLWQRQMDQLSVRVLSKAYELP